LTNPRVLLVDDDERFLATLGRGLSLRSFEVEAVSSAAAALPFLDTAWPEVLVLDVAMPGMDGISFCQLARAKYTTPILMLSARDEVETRVAGLEAGADDYVAKPFDLDELVARLHAILRRTASRPSRGSLQYADVVVNLAEWTAQRAGIPLNLTAIEFQLLAELLEAPEVVHTRDGLFERIWGTTMDKESNVVDVHIYRLRRKLETVGRPPLIQTVKQAGYKLQI